MDVNRPLSKVRTAKAEKIRIYEEDCMDKYQKPQMTVYQYGSEDVIRTSPQSPETSFDNWGADPNPFSVLKEDK